MGEITIFNESFNELTTIEKRNKIMGLEEELKKLPQIELPVNHYFAPHNYAREITMEAGSIVVGKIHKHSHVNVISKGKCVVATEDGITQYEAPVTFISNAGTKRAVLNLTEVVWTTIHPTEKNDIDEIEKDVIANNYDLLEEGVCHGQQQQQQS
jgi:phosphohistidine swiveling domain-containing protein